MYTTLAWLASSSVAQLAVENSSLYTHTHTLAHTGYKHQHFPPVSLLKETITLQEPTGRQAGGDFLEKKKEAKLQ